MLYITDYYIAKEFHQDLIRCWLLTKFNGRKGRTYPNGHKCEKKECVICSSITHKYTLPQSFLTFISKGKNLDILISGLPNELRLLSIRYKNATITELERNEVKNFFIEAYEKWFQPFYGFKFLGLLNFNTCIYCNRNYTRTIQDVSGKKVLVSQMDHWFPKTSYPLLSLSFYNLIPCCSPCNTSIKQSNTNYRWDRALKNMVHPYLFFTKDNFTFSFINKDIASYNVKINAIKNSKIYRTLEFFKIEQVYNSHSDLELKSLLELRYKYPENYVNSLAKVFFKGKISVEEIYRNVFGVEILEKDYHKRSLNKFKYDIIQELLSIKNTKS